MSNILYVFVSSFTVFTAMIIQIFLFDTYRPVSDFFISTPDLIYVLWFYFNVSLSEAF